METDAPAAAAYLQKNRVALRLSIQEMAERSGVARNTLWAIETGRTKTVRAATLRKITDAIDKAQAETSVTA